MINCNGWFVGPYLSSPNWWCQYPSVVLIDQLQLGTAEAEGLSVGQSQVEASLYGDYWYEGPYDCQYDPFTFVEQGNATVASLTFTSSTLATYLPTNGNSISFSATISPATATGVIRFEIYDTSALVGVAMNSGSQTTPDYDFGQSQSGFSVPVTTGSGANLVYKLTTSSNVNAATAAVNSRDYGGYCKVRVFATVNGTEISGTFSGTSSNFARVPKDDNNNKMPDAGWTAGSTQITEQSTAPASDNDNNPAGNGTNGDGLTDFEEYRGVLVRGTHRRLNPFQKDLFIDSNVSVNIGYAVNLPLTKHWVFATELDSNRYVNFNYTNSAFGGNIAAHTNQRGLLVQQIAGLAFGPGLYGTTFVTVAPPFNPNTTTVCEVYVDAIRFDSPPTIGSIAPGDPQDDSGFSKTTGHEVGHGIGIDHFTYSGSRLTVMVSGFGWANSTWTNIPSQYDSVDTAQLRLH